jgi:putative transposase
MPSYRRHYREGGSYFFTVVTQHRQKILLNEDIRKSLRASITEVRKTLPFKVEAWVLLPDHLHCIWTLPENDDNYSLRWLLIKRGVSKRCKNYFDAKKQSTSRKSRNESTIWQRRFWEHHIRDDEDFERCMNYVHINPVQHGYVKRPIDYLYSTFHRCVKLGIYVQDWGSNPLEPTSHAQL